MPLEAHEEAARVALRRAEDVAGLPAEAVHLDTPLGVWTMWARRNPGRLPPLCAGGVNLS